MEYSLYVPLQSSDQIELISWSTKNEYIGHFDGLDSFWKNLCVLMELGKQKPGTTTT
jgi:hypothetical protein